MTFFTERDIVNIASLRKDDCMNNGNFNGYDPNGNNRGNNDFGFLGGFDPNSSGSAPYQSSDNYGGQSGGYPPYNSGSYGNPSSNYQPYSAPHTSAGYTPYNPAASATMTLADYSKRIFMWMGAGLLLTFAVALGLMFFLTSGGDEIQLARFEKFLPVFYGGIVFELILAFVLGLFVTKLPYKASMVMFLIYSVCSGVTITPLLCVYEVSSAIFAFAAAAAMFITLAVYGIVTKRDLTKLGTVMAVGLIVLLVYSTIMLIIGHYNSLLVGVLGIIIFIGLTAYDAQKIKTSYNALSGDETMLKKASVNLALQLYLDFINIFIYLLRLMGKQRN